MRRDVRGLRHGGGWLAESHLAGGPHPHRKNQNTPSAAPTRSMVAMMPGLRASGSTTKLALMLMMSGMTADFRPPGPVRAMSPASLHKR